MTDNKKPENGDIHHVPHQVNNNSVVLRVPKPNLQIAVLGLVAVITLFQTIQLVRISSTASSAPAKAVPASTTANSGTGTGSNADVPQSMVGGC